MHVLPFCFELISHITMYYKSNMFVLGEVFLHLPPGDGSEMEDVDCPEGTRGSVEGDVNAAEVNDRKTVSGAGRLAGGW